MSVRWQKVAIPLAAGMQNRVSDQALEPPALEVCKNAEFDELGGIRKRRAMSLILDDETGGDAIRRIVPYGDELVIFTSEGVYTYDDAGVGIQRSTYLAAVTEETSRFTSTAEQSVSERAELDGVVVYAWLSEDTATTTVRLSAYDKVTGGTILSERTIASATRPRLVALGTRVILLYVSGINLYAKALNTSSASALATSADAAPTSISAASITALDAVAYDADELVLAYGTAAGTSVRRINESLTTTLSNVAVRTTSQCIAVAVAPTGAVMVARDSGTNVEADLLNANLTDNTVGIAVGTGTTAIDQVAAAFKTVQDSGQYRCHVVWSSNERSSPTLNWECKTNYVDDAGTAGTEAVLANRLGVASQAFEYTVNGTSRVLVWLTFGIGATTGGVSFSQFQNVYVLADVDGTFHAKAVPGTGGGLSQITGHLPAVQALSSTEFATSLTERRVISLDGDDTDYAARSPREVVLTLDDDRARKTAQIGRTLYLAGSLVSQFDGVGVHELGFAVAPYYVDGLDTGAGNIADGTYTYRVSASWENAKGEIERSTSIGSDNVLMVGGGSTGGITTNPVHVTNKLDPPVVCEIWRTAVDPLADSPAYLVTSKDPTATGTNGYLENDPTLGDFSTYTDDLEDGPKTSGDYLVKHETFPENGAVLSNIAPPSATVIAAGGDRVFLAGIAGNPYRVAYSKLRGAGELVAFNDALYLDLPTEGGAVTAVAFVNDTPVAFCERGIYALIGSGFDNLGGGQNYIARLLSSDVGATTADAVAVTPQGVIFHSLKGWHLLDRGLSVRYIGAPVSDFDGNTFQDVSVMADQHQVRCFGDGTALVYDLVADQWSEWDMPGSVDAALYDGRYLVTDGSSIYRQELAHGAGTYSYSLDLETAWIKLDGLQGFRRIRRLLVLGEYRTAHRLRVRIAYDYASAWVDDFYWTVSPTTAGEPEQVETRPTRPKGQAIKIRITDRDASLDVPAPGEALKLTGLELELGIKRGAYRALPAAQKQ